MYRLLNIKRALTFFVIALSLTGLAAVTIYMADPDLRGVMEATNDRSPDGLSESSGMDKVWGFIVNNGMMVPLQMFLLTFIPIQFLYFVNILMTAILPGTLFGVALRLEAGKGLELITATIPHYIVEVFALCLFAAVLFDLNRVIRTKLNRSRNDKDGISFIKQVLDVIKIYLVLVLPMIIMAAFLETYIADMIFNFFQ